MPEERLAAPSTQATEPGYYAARGTNHVASAPAADTYEADKLLAHNILSIQKRDGLRAFWTTMINQPLGGIADHVV